MSEVLEVSKESVGKWKCDELAKYCKDHGILYYHGKTRFKKQEMIDAILAALPEDDVQEVEEEAVDTESEGYRVTSNEVKQNTGISRYLESIEKGQIVAFKKYGGNLSTAKVERVSFKRRQVKLVNKFGKEFLVDFKDIMWVRTKGRWPRYILDALKENQRKAVQDGIAR